MNGTYTFTMDSNPNLNTLALDIGDILSFTINIDLPATYGMSCKVEVCSISSKNGKMIMENLPILSLNIALYRFRWIFI